MATDSSSASTTPSTSPPKPTSTPRSAKGAVSRTNLNEEHIEDVARDEDGVFIEARPNEIVTLRFRWE